MVNDKVSDELNSVALEHYENADKYRNTLL
jgi:hypothetical protein